MTRLEDDATVTDGPTWRVTLDGMDVTDMCASADTEAQEVALYTDAEQTRTLTMKGRVVIERVD